MTKTILILAIITAFIAGSIFTVGIDYAEAKSTKLIKECDEKKPPKNDDKIKAHCELLELIRAIELTPGPPGADGTDLNFYQVTITDNNNNFAIALCDPLDTVVGGGGSGADGVGVPLPLITSGPTQQGNQQGWIATAQLVAGNTGALAFAICADTNP